MNDKRFDTLQDALEHYFGEGVEILRKERVYGGDINDAFRLTLSRGKEPACRTQDSHVPTDGLREVFLKTNSIDHLDFFLTEAGGLAALRQSRMIGVPEVLAVGTDTAGRISFLLMEYIGGVSRRGDYWENFGHELAKLHRAGFDEQPDEKYGFFEDNFIGASRQKNTWKSSWVEFYRTCRLEPQLRMAAGYLDGSAERRFSYLLEHLENYLPEPEFSSLLHGDLWGGNVICGNDGAAWLIDPAVYIGHYETDLAMTQLFGGFPRSFYDAYSEILPIRKDYQERRELYQLYHLLNHLNLFGSGYMGEVLRIVRRYS